MGLMFSIVSRFRKRATTKEVLEGIDEDIKKLESTLERNQKLQKKTVLSLLSFSVLAYIIAVAIFYFFLLPDNWSERAIWVVPFLGFPALVLFLKKVFHFFFVTRIRRIRKALEELNERKKQILEDVTENETYKIAKELLEKYDPHGKIIPREFAVKSVAKETRSPDGSSELRHRLNAARPDETNGTTSTPMSSPAARQPGQPMPMMRPNMSPMFRSPVAHGNGNATTPRQLVRGPTPQRPNLQQYPILPKERSFVDKVAEYFVGDGPSYRYALVCKACHSHNGMALKDEFEYIAFRCCYCGFGNEARKKRLDAPTLDEDLKSQGPDKETPSKEKIKEMSKDSDNEVQEKQGEVEENEIEADNSKESVEIENSESDHQQTKGENIEDLEAKEKSSLEQDSE
eukprot:gene3250-3731_t